MFNYPDNLDSIWIVQNRKEVKHFSSEYFCFVMFETESCLAAIFRILINEVV